MPRRNPNHDDLETRIAITEDKEAVAVRLAMHETYVGLMRLARERMPTANFTDIYVISAVIVGTLQERPMSALKLSHFTGLPHQTVGRRLNSLVRRGYVKRSGNVYIAHKLPPITDSVIKRLVPLLRRTLEVFNVHFGQFD